MEFAVWTSSSAYFSRLICGAAARGAPRCCVENVFVGTSADAGALRAKARMADFIVENLRVAARAVMQCFLACGCDSCFSRSAAAAADATRDGRQCCSPTWLVSAMRSHCAFTRFAVRASAHEAFRWFKRCNEMLKTPLRAMPLQLVLIKMGLVLASQSARASRSGICATPKLCETNQRSALPTRPEARAIVDISTHAKDLTSASREYSPLMPNKSKDL
jgi:hypothetical protein